MIVAKYLLVYFLNSKTLHYLFENLWLYQQHPNLMLYSKYHDDMLDQQKFRVAEPDSQIVPASLQKVFSHTMQVCLRLSYNDDPLRVAISENDCSEQ